MVVEGWLCRRKTALRLFPIFAGNPALLHYTLPTVSVNRAQAAKREKITQAQRERSDIAAPVRLAHGA
jgi:hypothetical protein